MSAKAEITSLAAPIADSALDQLADVLVDCVAGGASVSFMSPFPHDSALGFFRKVAGSVAAGDTALLAARLDGKIVGMLGESGHELGQFSWAHGIACPSENTIYVADMNNWRVQKLMLHPSSAKPTAAR